ncbi:PadR family transcriptional regulator [Neobacillus sp. DY30]|uniref:PadR family transcriptional regulator n=1 Tax=Neobacillus sp. DY30 TaxID=3047871 RepID=UPI0024BFDF79|nr:PadR family transcriptional regulator [Neobacillus sp. DY30]WHY01565.1 PadR family transcriptional regulator [Neobacillus sp. DY30]
MSKLIILGLLKKKPMHGYEIQTIIQESRMDQWANVLSGSIYYALNKMEDEGIIETVKEERTGARIRKIYGITEKGEQQYYVLLKQHLGSQPHSLKSDFMLSLAMIDQLSKQEAIQILEDNLRNLEASKREWELGQGNKAASGAYNPIMEIAFESTLQIIEADIQMIQKVINHIK